MKQFVAIFLFIVCCVTHVNAQSFLDRLKRVNNGSGTVTVVQSKAVDELVNGKKFAPAKSANKDSVVVKHARKAIATDSIIHKAKKNPSVTKHRYRKGAYRVQAYAGNNSRDSKNKAQSIGARLRAEFPGLPVSVHFYSPRWVCRIGNFASRADAEQVLQRVRSMGFSRASLVRGKTRAH